MKLQTYNNNNTTALTMTSLEIAELTGKTHAHVLRDIEKILNELNIALANFGSTYTDSWNRQQKCYSLDKQLTMTLLAGYSITLRSKVVERWLQLEQQLLPTNPLDMIIMQAQVMKQQQEQLNQITDNVISINEKMESLETKTGTVWASMPTNCVSKSTLVAAVNKRYGLPTWVIEQVLSDKVLPAGMVVNAHDSAGGMKYFVYYKKDITNTFKQFVAECTKDAKAKTKYNHPTIEKKFKLVA
ncbi:Rha family transcriptional regulator [Pseudoalteromonas sp. SCQQ13]|uniref:Rha family transcriptional regulator n=1 Tax=Pseudoalteromonas sp. SCQQ13 TaxID=2792066 RepID=UPI0018CF29C7|nr:Rha family transcriptional regulator [Pseudoalteromonas sp. SCQQ13]MBH0093343.1 Rha family transcriptional regulator [Pseudoalteromonas sp. SCQQ13]